MKENWLSRIIGARIIKTGLATFLTALICMSLSLNPIFAVITSIVTIEPTAKASLKKAYVRFPASILGAFIAVISTYFFGESPLSYSLAATVTILICYQLKLMDGMLVAAITAVAMVPVIHEAFVYNFVSRLATTTIGLVTAGIVNFIILPPKYIYQIESINSEMDNKILKIYINRLKELLLGEYESATSMKNMTTLQQSATKIEQLIKYQKEEYDYHRTKKESKSHIRKVEMKYHTNRLLNAHLLNLIYLPENTHIIFTEKERIALSNFLKSYEHLESTNEFMKQKKAASTLKNSVKGLDEFDENQIKSHVIYELLMINKILNDRYSKISK
ncbi:aromatic acid exporter family protein [Mammaliicoccus fleurettii]|uniref:FUSC family protein n=1 Tax=Mammaliicoccus fleurettii TaxID=150056 RepID=UPI002DB811B0|nr:aromatic acid exporter family protein [Mammaliicoccus fleurettii]MEB7806850.1 aromatic acid exporter family protein [Mammaliicoccus fleurettii]